MAAAVAAAGTAALLDVQITELKGAVVGASITHLSSSSISGAPLDRFTLRIPFCKSSLKWRVILNGEQPQVAPDLMLGKGEENLIDLAAVRALHAWDPRRPRALADIVLEVLALYKLQQRRAVLAFPSERLHFEVSLVQDRPGTEFLLVHSPDHGPEIRVSLPLEVQELNQGARPEQRLQLFVAWRPEVRDTPTASLISNPHLDAILGDVALPPWRAEGCLMDFIPAVETVVRDAVADFAYRKAFVQQCLLLLGSPLEYDSVSYRKISFLLGEEKARAKDEKDVLMIIIMSLPLTFQKDKPTIVVQSVLPGRTGKPIARSATNFPWTPRAPAEDNIKKLRAYFAEVRVDFAAAIEQELKAIND